ncbi:MAG: hypothetical protein ACLTW9_26675 [Enterocloster sp.]
MTNILAMPDARGTKGSVGDSGKVSVSGANENRRYALTDMDCCGVVLEPKQGSQLKNAGFTGLNPCTSYYAIYGAELSADPDIGVILPVDLDPDIFSPPSRVTE